MKVKDIDKLVEILKINDLKSIQYKENGIEISVEAHGLEVSTASLRPVTEGVPTTNTESEKGQTFKSPLVGIYYGRPGPSEDSFVEVGRKIKAGDTLCIVEAMKVMNEIKADKPGIVQEILMSDGDMVEFDQPLFIIQ